MKSTTTLTILFLFLTGFTLNAQMNQSAENQQGDQQGMMKQESGMMHDGMPMMNKGMCPMCGQMMSNEMPMAKHMMMVNHLPYFQDELNLTDNQVERLIDLQSDFQKQQIDNNADLRKQQMKLKSLMKENASSTQVRSQLEKCANAQVEMKMDAYETISKMKEVLDDNQKKQFQNMMMSGKDIKEKDGVLQQPDRMKNNNMRKNQ